MHTPPHLTSSVTSHSLSLHLNICAYNQCVSIVVCWRQKSGTQHTVAFYEKSARRAVGVSCGGLKSTKNVVFLLTLLALHLTHMHACMHTATSSRQTHLSLSLSWHSAKFINSLIYVSLSRSLPLYLLVGEIFIGRSPAGNFLPMQPNSFFFVPINVSFIMHRTLDSMMTAT
jgi:hypothetical protein